jgi:hypothetical protein
VLSPASLAVGKIPIPASLLGKTALGAGVGAAGGAVAPTENESQAQLNALIGAAGGAVLPGVIQGVSKAAEWGVNKLASPFADLFTKAGPVNIANRYIRGDKVVGEAGMPAVLQATGNAQPLIPGSKPTVAQAVANIPEGSPLITLQDITSKSGGGRSAAFGRRIREQDFANQVAQETRDTFTNPMRSLALSQANQGGVKSAPIVSEIAQMADKPGDRASDVVSKTLGAIRNKIESLTDDTGRIDAADLYTIRKEIGNVIQQHAKDSANWDKKLASRLEREIQLQVDDAITNAGGTGWKAYLAEYASRSKAIDADTVRRELAKNPLQKTNLGGGINIAEETRPHLPNLLSRPAMMLNFVLRKAGYGVEPKVDKAMQEMFLDPARFTEVMSKLPPETKIEVQKLIQRTNALAFGGAAAQ